MFHFLDKTTGLQGMEMFTSVLMIVFFFVIFYFMIIRPQKKREKLVKEMLSQLVKGDKILTIGGIIGKIVSIKEETCVIETSRDGTKIRILKTAIRSVDVKAEDAK